MIEIKNERIFGKVIADALVSVDSNGSLQVWEKARWMKAIHKALNLLEAQKDFIEYRKSDGKTIIWSDSNKIYTTDTACDCRAFVEFGQPCKHRALAKLIKNYLLEVENEILAGETVEEKVEEITYLKQPTGAKPMKVGNIRI